MKIFGQQCQLASLLTFGWELSFAVRLLHIETCKNGPSLLFLSPSSCMLIQTICIAVVMEFYSVFESVNHVTSFTSGRDKSNFAVQIAGEKKIEVYVKLLLETHLNYQASEC